MPLADLVMPNSKTGLHHNTMWPERLYPMPLQRDLYTSTEIPAVSTTSRGYLVSKIYCKLRYGRSGNHPDLDYLGHSALAIQEVNSTRAFWLSISELHD